MYQVMCQAWTAVYTSDLKAILTNNTHQNVSPPADEFAATGPGCFFRPGPR